MDFGHYKYPVFQVPAGKSLEEILKEEARKGLDRRIEQIREEGKISPLNRFASIVSGWNTSSSKSSRWACGYFLIVADFIDYARRSDIPVGPGRGSAAGSLVAYCLKITNVDPMKYGLLFERFLNPQRITMPDIDIDFCMNGRGRRDPLCGREIRPGKRLPDHHLWNHESQSGHPGCGEDSQHCIRGCGPDRQTGPAGPKVSLSKAMEEEPELRKLEQERLSTKKSLPCQGPLKASRGMLRPTPPVW